MMVIFLDAQIPERAMEWRNDERIYKWCRQYRPVTCAEHLRWLDKIDKDPSISMHGVCVSGQDERHIPVGVAGLTSIDRHNRNAEFSLYIATAFQKKGFGRPALDALLIYGFNVLGLNRIWGEVFDGNPAMTMFQKIGFRHEGVLKQSYFRNGKFINSHMIGITAREYDVLD